ncbi:MAG: hypothetical protein VX589_16010 [Myxococcota bacterium]|nr:hypothetical protein [Myxococcota bacterium]
MKVFCVISIVVLSGCAAGELQDVSVDGAIIGERSDGGLPTMGECQPGERQCQGLVKTQTCRDNGTWAVPRNCVRAMCVEGVCKRNQSECGTACTVGEQRCSGPTERQTCREGDNGCGAWEAPTMCPAGQVCDPISNMCASSVCDSVCTVGATQCAGTQVMVCERMDNCTNWGVPMQCPAGQTCSEDRCREGCMDNCTEGSARCSGDEIQICSTQGNSCLGFGAPMACPAGQACDATTNACTSQCPVGDCQMGQTRCFQNGLQQCGQDINGCLIWARIDACPNGQGCPDGQAACIATCQAQCILGQRRCDTRGYQVCEIGPAGCETWSLELDCGPGQICEGEGMCVLEDACQEGSFEIRECGACGIQTRECANGQWINWSPCAGDGVTESRACNSCGSQQRSCGINGNWQEWLPCQGQEQDNLMCDPGGFGFCMPDGTCQFST